MIGDFLVGHAAETAEQEDVAKRLRKAQHDFLQEQGCVLCCGLGGGKRLPCVQFLSPAIAAVTAHEQIAGDLEQKGLWFTDFDRTLLSQDIEIGVLKEVFGEVGAIPMSQRAEQPCAVGSEKGLGVASGRKRRHGFRLSTTRRHEFASDQRDRPSGLTEPSLGRGKRKGRGALQPPWAYKRRLRVVLNRGSHASTPLCDAPPG